MLGCLFPMTGETRTSNQGGGSFISGSGKVAAGQMTQLTADEIQILADTANNLNPAVDLTLSDDQAQVIVDFLVANGLNTPDDFLNLDPSSVQIPEGAEQLIGSMGQFGGDG
jgi:hypothetical protein